MKRLTIKPDAVLTNHDAGFLNYLIDEKYLEIDFLTPVQQKALEGIEHTTTAVHTLGEKFFEEDATAVLYSCFVSAMDEDPATVIKLKGLSDKILENTERYKNYRPVNDTIDLSIFESSFFSYKLFPSAGAIPGEAVLVGIVTIGNFAFFTVRDLGLEFDNYLDSNLVPAAMTDSVFRFLHCLDQRNPKIDLNDFTNFSNELMDTVRGLGLSFLSRGL